MDDPASHGFQSRLTHHQAYSYHSGMTGQCVAYTYTQYQRCREVDAGVNKGLESSLPYTPNDHGECQQPLIDCPFVKYDHRACHSQDRSG
ncbi:hypothetical protein BaRGS_00014439 [Batillaria attramentaria]|uniref:Uncharacterized protein n=1 Tax=Batillaria attramentaria TaxID=370345 RepID=A0ABD0L4A0_9CAEN